MELPTTTVTRIKSNTNIATFRLINTHTHTNASKKNTHTHTLQYRKKAKKEKHTHTHTPKNTKQSIQKNQQQYEKLHTNHIPTSTKYQNQ